MNVQDKTALITGGSRGIGYAVAERLKSEGANVVITARTTSQLDAAAESLNKIEAGNIFAVPSDVSKEALVDELVEDTIKEYGQIDILVNNAGISGHGKVHDITPHEAKKVLDINLFGVYLLCHKVIPHMTERELGFIFNISSFAGTKGLPGSGVYGASKAGIIKLSESMQRDLKNFGIKVTAICPGYVYTDMAESSGVKKDEMIQPSDIAETMLYIMRLSESALVQKIVLERFGSV